MSVYRDPAGSVAAYLAVTISGQGPFTFLLDTGPSRTTIDRKPPGRPGLEPVEPEPPSPTVTGVVTQTEAGLVRLNDWQLGEVNVPTLVVATLDLPSPSERLDPKAVGGPLGSDVLSAFGQVLVSHEGEVLRLPAPKTEKMGAPIRSAHQNNRCCPSASRRPAPSTADWQTAG